MTVNDPKKSESHQTEKLWSGSETPVPLPAPSPDSSNAPLYLAELIHSPLKEWPRTDKAHTDGLKVSVES